MERKKPIKRSKPPKQKTPLKRGAPPKKRSKKMEATYEKRRPFVAKILSERPNCEACVVFAKHDGKTTLKITFLPYARNATQELEIIRNYLLI
jgi:hypothetical protein